MSMSTHVIGFKPPDEKWKKMKAVWDACAEANVPLPKDVQNFFEGRKPDAAGVEVDLEDHPCVKKYDNARGKQGLEVDVTKLQKDVTVIRFYNSY